MTGLVKVRFGSKVSCSRCRLGWLVSWLVTCLSFQQHASVSQGRSAQTSLRAATLR